MINDYLYLGESPAGESCAQLGSERFYERSRAELEALRNQLKRMFPLATCHLRIFRQEHDFREYHTLVVSFNPNDEQQVSDAYEIEAGFPENWDEQALEELKTKGFEVSR